jgi:hypothetical protein
MGKHSIPQEGSRARVPLLSVATAIGGICIAVATAGTAEAKTHHGNYAPGDPFGGFPASGGSPTSYSAGARSSTTSIVIRSTGTKTTTSINGTTSGTKTGSTGTGTLGSKNGNKGTGTTNTGTPTTNTGTRTNNAGIGTTNAGIGNPGNTGNYGSGNTGVGGANAANTGAGNSSKTSGKSHH